MNKIERIKELIQEINKASSLYYNGKQSSMTDKEWDTRFDELKTLELETNFISSDSPTQKVGYEVVDFLEKVRHSKAMLSLDKTKDINELSKFLGNQKGVLSWKEDGLTIVLSYEDGILIDAVTRGGGDVGSRILHNARAFKNIPQKINYKSRLVIRGEGLISREDFEKINVNGEYANPRNLASGSIMSLDSKTAKQRHLQFKAFSIAECEKTFELYSEQLNWLEILGFDVVEYLIVDKNNLAESVKAFEEVINKYSFSTDGLVLAFNSLEYSSKQSATSHHEGYAMAFKWADSTKETILRDIQFQVGRTGVITPVAVFDDIELEDTIVNKASLHNISILKSLELGIGDTITTYKANKIIPQVDDNLTRSNTFILPTVCPVCRGEVELKSSEQAEFLYCTNPECNAKISQKIKHYCNKNAMNVDGLSIKSIEKFIEKGFIKDITDIYKLDQFKKEIISMEGFGTKSYNKLIDSIESSKKCNLHQLIFGLGIPQVGLSTAKELANQFKTIEKLSSCILQELYNINDIGDVTANSIYNYFNSEQNQITLNELLKYIEFEQEEKKDTTNIQDSPLKGAKVYPTGKFNLKKDELKIKLEGLGATIASGYAKSLDYLICGGDTSKSGKVDRAIKDGVKLMLEEELTKYIK
jgi:DNA ligase, NAD-dependent